MYENDSKNYQTNQLTAASQVHRILVSGITAPQVGKVVTHLVTIQLREAEVMT
jgi:hypothetical protein